MATATERIEDLRVAWERDLERDFAASPRGVRSPAVDPGRNEPRVQLVPAMAARVHRIAELAAHRLGCSDPFVLYQTPRTGPRVSAQALLMQTPFAIRLIGPVASVLDDEALAALIGHEIGHHLAQGRRAKPASLVLQAWERGATEVVCAMGLLASELTADRFSVIAAGGEIEPLVRLEIAIMTLDSPSALGARELEYLAESCRQVEAREVPLCNVHNWRGYPSSSFRLFAAWLFWRSDVHRDLTGRGPGDLALRDVDAQLREMGEEAITRERTRAFPQATATRAAPVIEIERADENDDSPDLEELDDLEVRFRALERDAAKTSAAEGATSVDDLEARFRALEESARTK